MAISAGKVPAAVQESPDMTTAAPAAAQLPATDPTGAEIAQQYAQYVELAGLARLVSDESCWDEGTSSLVGSFVVE
jgi:hypothetical protein